MSERAPYSRVYWSVNRDPKFHGIYSDDGAFALWVRLLMTADALWPADAPLPRSARPRSLAKLVKAGIVDLMPDDFYRIRGLDAERGRRSAAATRPPTGTQLGPKRDPDGNTAETSQDKPSTRQAETPRDPADIYWQLIGKYPTDKVLSWVDDLTGKYGADATIRALVRAHTDDRATSTLLGRAQDALRAEARELDRQERSDEKARLAAKRAEPRLEEPWRADLRAAIERQYREGGLG